MTMTRTILSRVQAAADQPGSPTLPALASIARKLASDNDAVDKAHFTAGILKKLDPPDQDLVLRAIEVLAPEARP